MDSMIVCDADLVSLTTKYAKKETSILVVEFSY